MAMNIGKVSIVLRNRTDAPVRHTFAYCTFSLCRAWPLWACVTLRHLSLVNMELAVFISLIDTEFIAYLLLYFCEDGMTLAT